MYFKCKVLYIFNIQGTAGRPFWFFELDPISAGGPYNITVVSSQGCALTLKDVLFGDVWLCSGQSNMVFPLHEVT